MYFTFAVAVGGVGILNSRFEGLFSFVSYASDQLGESLAFNGRFVMTADFKRTPSRQSTRSPNQKAALNLGQPLQLDTVEEKVLKEAGDVAEAAQTAGTASSMESQYISIKCCFL